MRNRSKVSIFATIFIFALATSIAVSGYEKERQDKSGRTKVDLFGQIELFADAVSILKSDYVDEIDANKLMYGAMSGMLASLDDYSSFMEPDEYEDIKVETKGEFGGIGVEISLRDGILTVITPIAGSPAEVSGVKAGDKVIKIDGKITKNIKTSEAVKQMRGKPGTTVTLTVWREEGQKILDIPIKRDVIQIHSVKKAKLIEDKIGYIKLAEFQENTARDFEAALKKLESEGMDSLIFDIRNNPGGLLEGAIEVAERFLPKDKEVVSIKARNPKQNKVFKSSGKFTHPDYPLIVMVNEGSASGSEIVAGAVQDNKRGIILGKKTFGKASVQAIVPLKDGSGLRFTTASYYTPSGKLIRSEGIVPDVISEWEEAATPKKSDSTDIFEKLESKEKIPAKESAGAEEMKGDSQLRMAVSLMKAIKTLKTPSRQ